jgi:tRNA A-37 threonylcarbamoyl transferase component Bud32
VLSVAALTPSRGFEFLIDACARLKRDGASVECNIVGDGALRGVTQHWIDHHGMSGGVALLGALPQHEIARLMGDTDIFVLPSVIASDGQMDGVPVTLMEAMAAGKPVIAAVFSGIPELVDDGVSGLLIDTTHPDRIAEAIHQLAGDPELRRRMGLAGRKKIREEFDIRRTVVSLVELLDGRRTEPAPAAERLLSLNWAPLDPCAFGVRRFHERRDSYVAEVAITDGIVVREVVVKQQRPRKTESRQAIERARTEHEALSLLRCMTDDASSAGITCAVPRVLAFDEPRAALVLERARGRSLERTVRMARLRVGKKPAALVGRAGTWLAWMQNCTRSKDDGRHILTALVVLALHDVELGAAGDTFVRRQRARILERLRALEYRVAATDLPLVGHHGDYWPGNVFVSDDRVDVIDFEGYRQGLALEDVAQFLLHLELYFAYPLMGRPLSVLRDAFLDGYRDAGGVIDAEGLKLFTLAAALRSIAQTRGKRGAVHDILRRRVLRQIIARSLS